MVGDAVVDRLRKASEAVISAEQVLANARSELHAAIIIISAQSGLSRHDIAEMVHVTYATVTVILREHEKKSGEWIRSAHAKEHHGVKINAIKEKAAKRR